MRKNKLLEIFFKTFVLICLFNLCLFLILLNKKVERLNTSPIIKYFKEAEKIDTCGEECKNEIAKEVAKAVATTAAIPRKTAIVTPAAPAATEEKTAFIPLSGPITTTSMDWTDAPGTDVYIDLANDYTKDAYVVWQASLSVANANGQAFARLFDVTHGIGVSGSEVSTVNNATSQMASSGRLNLWSGNNLYRVQIKSLNSFAVTFGSGRIKISY